MKWIVTYTVIRRPMIEGILSRRKVSSPELLLSSTNGYLFRTAARKGTARCWSASGFKS